MAVNAEPITVRRWRCPWCHRSWSSKQHAQTHTDACWLDPDNRSCKTCRHHVPFQMSDCMERPGCRCQEIAEHCDAGVDMSDPDEPDRTIVQVNCPLWQTS